MNIQEIIKKHLQKKETFADTKLERGYNECIDDLIAKLPDIEAEIVENIKVDFLRQFLNESPNWKGKLWTNDGIKDFIKLSYNKDN